MIRRSIFAVAAVAALAIGGTTGALAASPAGTTGGTQLLFQGAMTADQVAGAGSDSDAFGVATVRIDTVTELMTVDTSWSGMSGPVDRSHIHSGPPGVSRTDYYFEEVIDFGGPARTVDCPYFGFDLCAPPTGTAHHEVQTPVLDQGPPADCYTFQCFVDFAIPNGFYIDMHTELYDGGEIRGQLDFAGWQPDGRVRAGTTAALQGDDRYNADAKKQRVTLIGAAGKTLIFGVSLQNDALSLGDSILLAVSGAATPGYTVRYLIGTADITASVEGGTYHTRSLRPGTDVLITVKITVKSAAAVGSSLTRTLTLTSKGDPQRSDTVKITAKRG